MKILVFWARIRVQAIDGLADNRPRFSWCRRATRRMGWDPDFIMNKSLSALPFDET